MKHILLSLIALSLVLSGCFLFGEQEVNTTENITPVAPPPPAPSFTISTPTNGEVIMLADGTTDVTLVMTTKNLVLKSPGGQNTDGEGHFKITLDGVSSGTAATKIHVLSGLELGSHTVEVELVRNDGTSYTPKLLRQVAFSLEKEEPEVYEPEEHTVTMLDFEYDPAEITVKQTDSITFVNEGSFPRSATCFMNGFEVFNTGVLGPGQTATVTLDDVMECEYYSTTHMLMKGNVIVESNGVE